MSYALWKNHHVTFKERTMKQLSKDERIQIEKDINVKLKLRGSKIKAERLALSKINLKKQLEKAGEKQGQGIMVVGELRIKESSGVITGDREQWVFYEFPPNEWMPKDTLDNE